LARLDVNRGRSWLGTSWREASGLAGPCEAEANGFIAGVRNPRLVSKKEGEGRLYTDLSKELGIKRLDLRILASEKLAPIPMG